MVQKLRGWFACTDSAQPEDRRLRAHRAARRRLLPGGLSPTALAAPLGRGDDPPSVLSPSRGRCSIFTPARTRPRARSYPRFARVNAVPDSYLASPVRAESKDKNQDTEGRRRWRGGKKGQGRGQREKEG